MKENRTVLITGGLGFIGSHTSVELLERDYTVIIVDDLSNSKIENLDRIHEIAGKKPIFYQFNLLNTDLLDKVFSENDIDLVIHFAAFKAVGESVEKPLDYYQNNLGITLNLLRVMKDHGVNRFIFSSSATVYAPGNPMPLTEEGLVGSAINPYGWTKIMAEQILQDTCKASPDLSVVSLRYFNPIGAHQSGLIGEDPQGIPNNLMPYITRVAKGLYPQLSVFGDDYETPDGTCIRDYIHVVDLARGHVDAMDYCKDHKGFEVFNLGTGKGTSVLDLVEAFKAANQVDVPYQISGRRPGDLPVVYANADKAKAVLGWEAKETLESMCKDAWRFEQGERP